MSADEFGDPTTHVGRVYVSTVFWELGEPYPGSNSRPMTYKGGKSEVVEVETTVRTRVLPPAKPTERGAFSTPAAILLALAPLLAVILPGAAHVAWLLLTGWLGTFPLFCIGVGAVGLALLVASAHVGADGRKRLLP